MRDRTLFWVLIFIQAIGCQIILWTGLPIYHRLLAGGSQGATDVQLGLAVFALVIMQLGHWTSLRLKRRLRFPRRVFLGHVLFCVGEFSLLFSSALAILVMFDRFEEVRFNVWNMVLLAAILFSVCSYKYQVGTLGVELIEGKSGDDEGVV